MHPSAGHLEVANAADCGRGVLKLNYVDLTSAGSSVANIRGMTLMLLRPAAALTTLNKKNKTKKTKEEEGKKSTHWESCTADTLAYIVQCIHRSPFSSSVVVYFFLGYPFCL